MNVRTSVMRGFALLALSSLTFAACDDKTTDIAPLPVSVTVTPQTVNLQAGQTTTLVAVVQNAANQNVTWTSANPAVATVNAQGQVTAVAAGTAVVTAASVQDPNARAAAAVVVTAAPTPVITLQLVPPAASVQVNQTIQLVPIVGGSTNQAVTYTSSTPAVATVDAAGLVRGVAAGTAVITARTVATPQAVATSTITVTAAPPAPTPTITITPTQASAQVGGTQQFVANVTGVTNTAVTWRSESPSVATINAQGLATGVTAGTAVITAIAQADTTRRVQAVLQVTAAPPVTQPAISVSTVTIVGTGVAVTPGQTLANQNFNAVVNVSAGSEARIGRVEIRLGDAAACEQTFNPPLAATQGVQTISCVVNTQRLNAQGEPVFPNGTYTVSAVAFNEAGAQVAQAQWGSVVVANTNQLNFTVTTNAVAGSGSVFVQGVEWREGDVVVTARPVIFTGGQTVGNVQICVEALDGPVTAPACRTVSTATDGAYVATFPKANAPGHATAPGVAGITTTALQVYGTTTFTGGAAGPMIALGAGPLIRLDNVPPTTTAGTLPRSWFDGTFQFTAANIITTAAVDPTPGVSDPTRLGGFTYEFRYVTAAQYAANTTTATRFAAGTTVTNAGQIPASDVSTAYHLFVRVRDALGNFQTIEVPSTFGVDLQAPTFTIDAGAPANMLINPVTSFSFGFTDDRAGFEANPVQVRITRWIYTGTPGSTATSQRRCINPNTGAVLGGDPGTANPCAWQDLASNTFDVPAADGYYMIEIRVRDRAGNVSAVQERLVLRDMTAPVANVSAFAVSGNDVSLNFTITDNVDLRGWDTRVQFTGAAAPTGATTATLPITAFQQLGSFGLDNRIGIVSASANITTWRSLFVTDGTGNTAGGVRTQASGVGVGAWDVARNFTAETGGFVSVGQTGGDLPTALSNFNVAFTTGTAPHILCNGWTGTLPSGDTGTACAATPQPATRVIRATATGPTGTFENPFSQVNFYAVYPNGSVVLLGSVAGNTAQVVEQTAPTVNRLYRYDFTFDATQRPAGNYQLFAVGVQANRDAVRSPTQAVEIRGAANLATTLTDRP
jgi:uncharacterized protein YjdB